MTKRFLVFAGETYYPECGWYDFIKDFDTLEEAKEEIEKFKDEKNEEYSGECFDWAQVVDLENEEDKIVYSVNLFSERYNKKGD